MEPLSRKETGAYYTPTEVAASLVKWAVSKSSDRMLDPSCGDGRFLSFHRLSAGVEQDPEALKAAMVRAPWSMIHEGEFFNWAKETKERFDCTAGNPPFIRYQLFTGEVRKKALSLCARLGVKISSLSSSWAPFLVGAASLLKRGGRMAFVVPAEIGHAPYAIPLLEYLARNFSVVQLIAVRKKIFPELSEDCWLLYAEGFGEKTDHFRLTVRESFTYSPIPPSDYMDVPISDWRQWNCRIRPFLMPNRIQRLYRRLADALGATRLGRVSRVSIGYVSGGNDFFHLRPSSAEKAGIPKEFLHPAVRKNAKLNGKAITHSTVQSWIERDEPVLLLRIQKGYELPPSVDRYLQGPEAMRVKETYKCRNRDPWYVIPDVHVPHAFLSYMSGKGPVLVANPAGCVCTNSVHAVIVKPPFSIESLQERWNTPLTRLSCEVEGHPLGGGILKIEPGEAANVVLGNSSEQSNSERQLLEEGIEVMRSWRHHA